MPEKLRHIKTVPGEINNKAVLKSQHGFYKLRVNKDGEFYGLMIKKACIVDELLKMNYFRFDFEENETFRFVRVSDNRVNEVSEENLVDAFFDHVEKIKPYDHEVTIQEKRLKHTVTADLIRQTLFEKIGEYFSRKLLARLKPPEKIIMKEDTKTEKFLYYRNGFVYITADGYKLLPYYELKGMIFENQVMSRDFVLDESQGDFELFIKRVCGHKGKAKDKLSDDVQVRFRSLCSIIGYLLHGYFDQQLFAVILNDSRISYEGQANGRTGKTLFAKALGRILNANDKARVFCEINGKDFRLNDKHRYGFAGIETRLININDISPKINILAFTNDITEGIIVDKKNEKPFRIYAKMVVSTNRTMMIEGDSNTARTIQFEFDDWYKKGFSPQDETGHWFFNDWDEKEWNRFDTFIVGCINLYLKNDRKIIEPKLININRRTLIDHVPMEFIDFMDDVLQTKEFTYTDHFLSDYQTINRKFSWGERVNKKELYLAFCQANMPDYDSKFFRQNTFTSYLRMYSRYAGGLKAIDRIHGTELRSSGQDYIIFDKDEKQV